VEQAQTERGPGDLGELLGQTESRDDPVHLVVEVYRAWARIDAVPSIEHQCLDAVAGQQGSRGHAGRAGADDDDRVVRSDHEITAPVIGRTAPSCAEPPGRAARPR